MWETMQDRAIVTMIYVKKPRFIHELRANYKSKTAKIQILVERRANYTKTGRCRNRQGMESSQETALWTDF